MSKSNADLFASVMPFVATVEQHTLTRAAQMLGVTPSAVSRAIARLESDLGAHLLNRTARTGTLTDERKPFYREGPKRVVRRRRAPDRTSPPPTSPRR